MGGPGAKTTEQGQQTVSPESFSSFFTSGSARKGLAGSPRCPEAFGPGIRQRTRGTSDQGICIRPRRRLTTELQPGAKASAPAAFIPKESAAHLVREVRQPTASSTLIALGASEGKGVDWSQAIRLRVRNRVRSSRRSAAPSRRSQIGVLVAPAPPYPSDKPAAISESISSSTTSQSNASAWAAAPRPLRRSRFSQRKQNEHLHL